MATTEEIAVPVVALEPHLCPLHPKKELVVYCKVHKVPICSSCTYSQHLGCHAKYLHDIGAFTNSADPEQLMNAPSAYQGLEETAKELSEQVETTISQPADAKEKILRASAAQVKTVLGDLHSQLNSTLNQLDADRDRILEAVTLRYKQHHDEVLAMAQKKEAALKEQEAKLSAHANVLTKDVTDVVGQISALDPEDNALELVQTCLKIINEAGPEIKNKIGFIESDVALEPVEKANLHLVLPPADSLLEQIQGRGWVGTLEVDASKSSLTGSSMASLATEHNYVLRLETRDQHGQPHAATDGLVKAFARIAGNDDKSFPMTIEHMGDNKYDLVLALSEEMASQQLEIHVSYGDIPLVDSPKRILVVKSLPDSGILSNLGKNAGLGVLVRVLPSKSFKLLYRASRDGWSAKDFHSRCDKMGPTLTLVKTEDGRCVFGGYTSQSWESIKGGAFKADKEAFLLSLVNPANIGPVKMRVRADQEANAIYCHKNQGPTFGAGKDICVMENADSSAVSSSNLNNSYSAPQGQDGKTFLAGNTNFTLGEMEVFQMVA